MVRIVEHSCCPSAFIVFLLNCRKCSLLDRCKTRGKGKCETVMLCFRFGALSTATASESEIIPLHTKLMFECLDKSRVVFSMKFEMADVV
jgi:hypothetical protein